MFQARSTCLMPGRHINDHQMRLYMKSRMTEKKPGPGQLITGAGGVLLIVFGDRAKVDQILLNLLSNAVKFTGSNGTVRVACKKSERTASIEVIDSGAGIAATKAPTPQAKNM